MHIRNRGEMNKRITIEKPILDSENILDNLEWEVHKEKWAFVYDVGGKEFHEASAEQMVRTTEFVIQYDTSIVESMRIIYKNDIYNIIQVNRGRNIGDFMSLRTQLKEQEGKR